jgi:hypothetical protein
MSVIRSLVLAAVISAGLTAPAFARDPVFTVKLAAPVAEQTQVIAQNTLWNCDGDTCLARADHAVSVRACRQFIREAGDVRVTAYGTEGRELTADELARCNGETVATQQAQN